MKPTDQMERAQIRQNIIRMPDKLPDKLSDLLEVALNDLRKAQKSGYTIDMGRWHNPIELGGLIERPHSCEICMAGAVMACTLHVPDYMWMDPDNWIWAGTVSIGQKLKAINHMRVGDIEQAWRVINRYRTVPDDLPPDRHMTNWEGYNESAFFADQEALLKDLREAGY